MFNWGVIGTGNIARIVCREITGSGRHRVVAVYSRTVERARKFADRFGAKCYADEEAFFADRNIDAVYIATPHSSHYYYLMRCVAHRIPVLTEKPFTVNACQAQAVFDAAKRENVFVCEGMWTRFLPVVKEVRRRTEASAIGEVLSFEGAFTLPLRLIRPFTPERVYKPEYAGGALLDLGVYPISFAQMLMGMPEKTVCSQTIKDGIDCEDNIQLHYKKGASRLFSSFNTLASFTGTIHGSEGKIVLPDFSRPVKAVIHGKNKKEVVRGKKGYVYEFDQCAEDISKGFVESSVISPHDTISVMKIMDECRRQNGLVYPCGIEEL